MVVEGDFEAEHRAKGDEALEPGKDHGKLSWSIFDQLYDDREGIEADFGGADCPVCGNVARGVDW